MKRASLAILSACMCAAAPFAFGQAPAAQPGASPSGQLDGFLGDGACTGGMMASGKKPGHSTTGTFHGEKTLDGKWVVIHYTEDRTAANPKPFSVVQYVGYDAAKQQFVTAMFDNSSATYSTGVSDGWKGNAITFDETVQIGGKPAAFRDVFTSGKSGMASHIGMMRDKSGQWVKTDEETCHTG